MTSALSEVLDAAIDMTLPADRLATAARRVNVTTEIETWVTEVTDIISDHGYSGQIWPTYVDLELLVTLRHSLFVRELSSGVRERIECQSDELVGASYGLLADLNARDASWPRELPVRIRYQHLRTILRAALGEGVRITKRQKVVFAGPSGMTNLEERFEALLPGDHDRVIKFDLFEPLNKLSFSEIAGLAADFSRAIHSEGG